MTPAPADERKPLPPRPLEGVRVMLVEDSWHVAEALRSILTDAGAIVAEPSASLPEANAQLAAGLPDAAVVDVNLQGEMAYSLIEQLASSGVPVIVTSGYELKTTLGTKVAAVLSKPVRAKDLLAELQRALAGRSPTT